MRFAGLGVAELTSPPTPTPTPEPTPAPTRALHGIEIFPGGSDTWAMAARPDAQSVSFGGSAPTGWFVASDAIPSDPSIVYQTLIATAIR